MISFVIVNFNLSRELQRCVGSLTEHIACDHEVIVVDNHSTDPDWPQCKAYLDGRADTVLVLRDDNAGFGRACNEGAQRSRGDILCFLNPDVIVHEDFTRRVMQWYSAHPRTAVVGVATNKTRFLDFSAGPPPGYLLEILSIFYVGRYLEAIWTRLRGVLTSGPMPVGWVMGACLFIRKRSFEAVGGFDPDYFLYYEEVDLCHRVRRAGGMICYDPAASVEHAGSASSRRDYALFTERFYVGKKKFFGKSRGALERRVFQAIVQCQIAMQYLLWSVLHLFRAGRAPGKLRGLARAARFRFAG